MKNSHKIEKRSLKDFDQFLERTIRKSERIEQGVGIAAVVISVIASVLTLFIDKLSSSSLRFQITTNSLYYVGGIAVLGMLILGVATLMRWRDRDVIDLRTRLSDIYLRALTESALNPQINVEFHD